MSIICWDGQTVAADRQGNRNDMRCVRPKLYPDRGLVLGVVGVVETGTRLVQWFMAGAKAEDWPEDILDKDWDGTLLLVFARDGVRTYCQAPVYDQVWDSFTAWGSGRDFAMGAMEMGADAVWAVKVACKFNVNCGMGIDQYRVADLKTFAQVMGGPKRRGKKHGG